MLRLISGLPGAGKTQYAIAEALKEKRPVYFCNMSIGENKPAGWTQHDFKEWGSLPAGSLLLVDEVQDYALAEGKQADEWVRELAKHRHHGIDIWLITQDPKQMHAYLRRLVGDWHDLVRIFGQNAATVSIRDKCDEKRPVIQSRIYRYDKKVWALYKSATVHTSHGRVPFKLVAGVLAVAVGLGVVVWKWNSAGAGVIDGTAARKSASSSLALAPSLSAPVAPAVLAPAVNLTSCSVLVGILHGINRAVLVFETVDGVTFHEAVHPLKLQQDEIKVRGCDYYLAGGSMLTRDSAAREAVGARKKQEREVQQVAIAPAVAPDVQPSTSVKASVPVPAADASSGAILEAIKAKNRDALKRAVVLVEGAERSASKP